MSRIFQSQTVFGQARGARLAQNFLKDFGKTLRAQARPKLRQEARLREPGLRRQIEKETKREIDLRLPNDVFVG